MGRSKKCYGSIGSVCVNFGISFVLKRKNSTSFFFNARNVKEESGRAEFDTMDVLLTIAALKFWESSQESGFLDSWSTNACKWVNGSGSGVVVELFSSKFTENSSINCSYLLIYALLIIWNSVKKILQF